MATFDVTEPSGTIEVDTRESTALIFLPVLNESSGDGSLVIKKISTDDNHITLVGIDSKIDGNEIAIFGLPLNSKYDKGKATEVTLYTDGKDWFTR